MKQGEPAVLVRLVSKCARTLCREHPALPLLEVSQAVGATPIRYGLAGPCRGELGTHLSERMILSRELQRAHTCVSPRCLGIPQC